MSYNNEVTYHKKWDTKDNRKALKELEDKFFDRSICYPSCPVGWAPEVLELLTYLDKEFGIARNTSTFRSYYIQGSALDHFVIDPIKNFASSFKDYFVTKHTESWKKYKSLLPLTKKIKQILSSTFHTIPYGFKAIKHRYIYHFLNKILKPKITLDQVKEKYGELTIYVSAPDYLQDYVDQLILKTTVKLAIKGCYYPVESMWNYSRSWHCGNDNDPDTYEVESGTYDGKPYLNIKKTLVRKIMKDLGLNLKEIEEKANASKQDDTV